MLPFQRLFCVFTDAAEDHHTTHQHLLLKHRRYGEFRREQSQVLQSVGCVRTAGFTVHDQKRAGEHKTTHSALTAKHTHTHRLDDHRGSAFAKIVLRLAASDCAH